MTGAVDSHALLELVWAAPLAAVTVTVAWGLLIWGSISAADARRDGRSVHAALSVGVAILGGTLFTAAVVFGLIVMTSKG